MYQTYICCRLSTDLYQLADNIKMSLLPSAPLSSYHTIMASSGYSLPTISTPPLCHLEPQAVLHNTETFPHLGIRAQVSALDCDVKDRPWQHLIQSFNWLFGNIYTRHSVSGSEDTSQTDSQIGQDHTELSDIRLTLVIYWSKTAGQQNITKWLAHIGSRLQNLFLNFHVFTDNCSCVS